MYTSFSADTEPTIAAATDGDLDPLVDLALSVTIERVRKIVVITGEEPTFSVSVTVGGQNWESISAQGFDVFNIGTAAFDIPDDEASVSVTIEVQEAGQTMDAANDGDIVAITYDVATGNWEGDDFLQDESGYGHSSGTEDGESTDRDYEIWFDIGCNDYDDDGLTYWEEINIYETDPEHNDAGMDYDDDGVPIEWEDHWGYDPFEAERHDRLDPDQDGLQNIEEFMMDEWFADPFRQDIYIENDYMEPRAGITPIMPVESMQLQYSAFTKHNIMLLIDDGLMGGSDQIPYQELDWEDYEAAYNDYFLNGDPNNPRKGVFHWAVIIHDAASMFGRGVGGFNFFGDSFAVCSAYVQRWRPWEEGSIIGHGGTYMHELGHQLGLPHLRCFPWQPIYWLSGRYQSCMNYRYNFKIVDYSDGTHGFMDVDEWSDLDLNRIDR